MLTPDEIELPREIRDRYRSAFPQLRDELEAFDPRLYFDSNPDVAAAALSSEDLIRHFCEFGHRECRLYAATVALTDLYTRAYPKLAERLRRFDPAEYRRANRDVPGAVGDERSIYEHFCRVGSMELRAVRSDGRVIDRREAVRRMSGRDVQADILVYAHLFFPDAARAVAPYIRNLVALGAEPRIAFSEVTFALEEMEQYAASVSIENGSLARYVRAPPEGRDWGGFHRLWCEGPPDDNSAVFFIHSKKSLHMAPIAGEMWSNELLNPICGSYGAVLSALDRLNDGYSMVGAALHKSHNVGTSRELILETLPLLGLDLKIEDVAFVGGTMFAVRGAVLNEFFRLIGDVINFRRLSRSANSFDGSMAHACERLVGYLASMRGKGIFWVL